ncbi:MAG TPA: alanine--tRNA ligase-related protein, partial [Candidatus Acidoferrum sp.]|nr:alanine--tRNA ligase-related protein [Candidatus Acidoferrum sp.]
RYPDGTITPLPKPSIDTGMGLERITAIVQGVESNYDTDLFGSFLRRIEKMSQRKYPPKGVEGISFRVIADHSRAATFLIGDGVLPSNEGRGYVLRRIMRRAMRHGRKLGINDPFLFQLTDEVVAAMSDAYPELASTREMVKMVIRSEEDRFSETLNVGLRLWAEERQKLKQEGRELIPGELIFKLYDTYGFPVDLTEEIARDEGFRIDRKGFEEAMEAQRARARESWKGSGEEGLKGVYKTLLARNLKTEFVGYEDLEARGRIIEILKADGEAESGQAGEEVEIVTDRSPFYGEMGGQEGDRGILTADGSSMEVAHSSRPLPDIIAHHGTIKTGTLRVGDNLTLKVDPLRRRKIMLNHTAAHLLQAAL